MGAEASLLGDYRTADWRQVVIIDEQGASAIHSGARTLGIHGVARGLNCAAAGNLLADPVVPDAMVGAFERADAPFPARLLTALEAGLAAGGEAGPVHSAGLLVVREVSWPVADLRVDWDDADPIGRLRALWTLYAPQLEDYVKRALDPDAAPSYGVPGDL